MSPGVGAGVGLGGWLRNATVRSPRSNNEVGLSSYVPGTGISVLFRSPVSSRPAMKLLY